MTNDLKNKTKRIIRIERKLPEIELDRCQNCKEPTDTYDMCVQRVYAVNNKLQKYKRKKEIKHLSKTQFFCVWCGVEIKND